MTVDFWHVKLNLPQLYSVISIFFCHPKHYNSIQFKDE